MAQTAAEQRRHRVLVSLNNVEWQAFKAWARRHKLKKATAARQAITRCVSFDTAIWNAKAPTL